MWANDQRREQKQIRRHRSEAAAELGIEIGGAQTLDRADQHRRNDRPRNAVEPGYDDDREHLEPDQRDPEAAAGDQHP